MPGRHATDPKIWYKMCHSSEKDFLNCMKAVEGGDKTCTDYRTRILVRSNRQSQWTTQNRLKLCKAKWWVMSHGYTQHRYAQHRCQECCLVRVTHFNSFFSSSITQTLYEHYSHSSVPLHGLSKTWWVVSTITSWKENWRYITETIWGLLHS